MLGEIETALQVAAVAADEMYGEGNTTKLVKDITSSTTQISNGLLDGMGVSLTDLVGNLFNKKDEKK